MSTSRVRIFYPADPLGVVAGGIDTFIRGLIKWAPDDIEFSLAGMTTDAEQRPVGAWRRWTIGAREFDFFPVVHTADAARRGRVPLSARYTVAAALARDALASGFDAFDFHRIEPALPFLADRRPKNAFFHQDPAVLRSAQSDIVWKRLPAAYESLESRLVPRLASAWCVRQTGVDTLRARYPMLADRIRFVPTWVDADTFTPADPARRAQLRHESSLRLGIDPRARRIVSVGRLDAQKDPDLLLDAFVWLLAQGRDAVLLMVGDGVARAGLERRVERLGIGRQVRFLGLLPPPQIADVLRAADVYALSSAYEGMPMALLEALGCGLPVASTDVGEVSRVVRPGVNGALCAVRDAASFGAALAEVLDRRDDYAGEPALAAVQAFQPQRVLGPVYDNYRELADGTRRWPGRAVAVAATRRGDYSGRRRAPVIGVPVDVLAQPRAREVIMAWAAARESRYVCFANVHSAVTFGRDARHARAIDGADLVAADGAPIAWVLRRKGHARQPRVDGPGTMWALCGDAQARSVKVGLLGSTAATLRALEAALRLRFPRLDIAYSRSPGAAELADDRESFFGEIDAAGVGLLFIALGCPKQERWMSSHRERVHATMLGVGAAFDYHAGVARRAPPWAQAAGLEWLHRLSTEPRRLLGRYLVTNTVFLARSAAELAGDRLQRLRARPVPASRHALGWSKQVEKQHMTELFARVDAALARRRGRIVGFIASGPGEGTTTLAAAYALAAAERSDRRVLLLHATSPAADRPGVLEALAAHDPLEAALMRHELGFWVGGLLGVGQDHDAWTPADRSATWKPLRGAFDEIVLDMPSAAESRLGVMTASRCDGVIVVLEAEKTRAPVVEALVASLEAVRANLLGTVLNKRQYHVPAALYRRL